MSLSSHKRPSVKTFGHECPAAKILNPSVIFSSLILNNFLTSPLAFSSFIVPLRLFHDNPSFPRNSIRSPCLPGTRMATLPPGGASPSAVSSFRWRGRTSPGKSHVLWAGHPTISPSELSGGRDRLVNRLSSLPLVFLRRTFPFLTSAPSG